MMTEQPIQLCVPKQLTGRTGGYRYVCNMAAALEAAGHETRIDLMPGDFLDVDVRAIGSLGKRLKKKNSGRVVLDGLASAGLAGLDARRLPRPAPILLVHHVFADDPDLGPMHRSRLAQAERVALERCAGVIATSRATAARLKELGARDERLHVVRAGTPSLPRNSDGARRDGPPRLLCVGPVVPSRGHDILIEALATLGGRDWHCRCVGTVRGARGWVRRLQTRTAELGLAERIEWAGELEGPGREAAWQEADLLVLSSRYDGCAMVVDEAMARGVPVITTRTGALAEPLSDGGGWIVPPGDGAALASALSEALDNPEQRRTIAANALATASGRPGWERQATAFVQAMGRLTGH